ncbi:MAG TPA: helix-turn-helix domain-containing protein [Rhizomicrobium sp.]|nr:helix-turn-helix domain-containing protein [Rhizomicrobium sp.]
MILTIRDVERAVCLRFQISRDALRERNPKRVASRPRQIAMYLARELTGASYPRLGQYFERDHTSILYAWQKTVERMGKDARLKTDIEGVKEVLTKSGRWKENVARAIKERGLAREAAE